MGHDACQPTVSAAHHHDGETVTVTADEGVAWCHYCACAVVSAGVLVLGQHLLWRRECGSNT